MPEFLSDFFEIIFEKCGQKGRFLTVKVEGKTDPRFVHQRLSRIRFEKIFDECVQNDDFLPIKSEGNNHLDFSPARGFFQEYF